MAAPLLSSVRAAARLLCTFTASDRELGVSELSRRLGLSKSTVHRLLTTLAAEHLIDETMLNVDPARERAGEIAGGVYTIGHTVTSPATPGIS